MLVVDDNKIKLLKMKEKILEISKETPHDVLNDYKDLAIQIDNEIFNDFISKIKNTNIHDLPYNKQLEFLFDIEQEYSDVNEMQYSLKNVWQKYSEELLPLGDLNQVLIDKIKERISNIQGYLINNEKLNKSENMLAELQVELGNLERQRSILQSRFGTMEKEMKYDFLKAEGRVNVRGESKFTSVSLEYADNGLNLRELFDNKEVFNQKLSTLEEEKNLAEDKMLAAKICYESMPTLQNKEIYDSIMKDMIIARYRLTLIQLVDLLNDEEVSYEKVLAKREKFKALNDVRINCLSKLDIYYLIDPVSRVRIDEQISSIKEYETISENIMVIRKRIDYLTKITNDRVAADKEFTDSLNKNEEYIIDKTKFEDVKDNIIPNDEIINLEDTSINISNKLSPIVLDSQVINVHDYSEKFELDKALEITDSVIKRVNNLFIENAKKEEPAVVETPELVIEESTPTNEQENAPVVDEEVNENEDEIKIESLIDEMPSLEEAKEETVESNLNEEYNSEKNDDLSNSIIEDAFGHEEDTPSITSKVTEAPVNSIDDDLFQDVSPFEKTPLFTDKSDDIISETERKQITPNDDFEIPVNENVSKEEINEEPFVEKKADMPNLFWNTQVDNTASNSNISEEELSFDEQINKLINNEESVEEKRRKR